MQILSTIILFLLFYVVSDAFNVVVVLQYHRYGKSDPYGFIKRYVPQPGRWIGYQFDKLIGFIAGRREGKR